MRIDRNAAAVVADRQPVAGGELDLDAGGMAGHRLVHGVVEHLGGEMMQAALVGAADIHAGAAADRLQPFEDLDVLGRIAVGGFCSRGVEQIGHGANITRDQVGASSIRYGYDRSGNYMLEAGSQRFASLGRAERADFRELCPAASALW